MAASAKIAAQTDILKTMEVVEDASAKTERTSGRKQTPPKASQSSSEDQRKRDMIKELGRRPSQERVPLYIRKTPERRSESPEKRRSEEKIIARSEQENGLDSLPTSSQQFMKGMGERLAMDVPTDFLNTIQEERTKSPSDEGSGNERKDSGDSNSSSTNYKYKKLTEKKKFPFNR